MYCIHFITTTQENKYVQNYFMSMENIGCGTVQIVNMLRKNPQNFGENLDKGVDRVTYFHTHPSIKILIVFLICLSPRKMQDIACLLTMTHSAFVNSSAFVDITVCATNRRIAFSCRVSAFACFQRRRLVRSLESMSEC